MRKVLELVLVSLTLLLTIFPEHALSQTTINVPLGRRVSISPGGTDRVRFTARPDESYCCELIASSTGTSAGVIFSGSIGSYTGSTTFINTFSIRGRDTPGTVSTSTSLDQLKRVCWHEAGEASSLNVLLAFTTTGTSDILCEQSSLVGGFNTSVTDFNFLEITVSNAQSPTNAASVQGVILIKTTVSSQTFRIPFDIQLTNAEQFKRTDVSIHDAIGNIKDFGQIRILHNGSTDQVQAKLTQYRIVTTSPLDFAPVNQEVFTNIPSN